MIAFAQLFSLVITAVLLMHWPWFIEHERDVHHATTLGLLVSMILAFLVLVGMPKLTAAYGRYARRGPRGVWGHPVDGRLAWCVQESPAFLVPFALAVTAPSEALGPANAIIVGMMCSS